MTGNASTRVAGALYAGLYVLAVNSKVKPLDNPLVKQALSLAIDREAIVKELWRGRGIVPSGPIAKGDNHFEASLPALKYDAKEARERLKKAGYKNEEIVVETTVGYMANDKPMAEAVVGMWRDAGVNAKVEVFEYSVRAQKNRDKTFKGLWWSDPTSTLADPDGMMWRLLGPGGPQDYWRHAEFDELGNAARFSVDEKFRGEAYKKMTRDLPRALPVDPRHPAVRGLRPPEARGVDAEPEPAVRDPEVQLQVQATQARRGAPPPFRAPHGLRRFVAASPRRIAPAKPALDTADLVRGVGGSWPDAGVLLLPRHALARALVALWLVSTVVFVVMRLSGDPVPLLLPPDAPRSEIFRVRTELGLDRPLDRAVRASSSATSLRGDFGRSIHFRAAGAERGRRLPSREPRARPHRLRRRRADRGAGRARVRDPAQHVRRPRRHGRRAGRASPRRRSSSASSSSCCCRCRRGSSRRRAAATGGTSCCPRITLGAFAMASIARLTRSAVLEVLRADFVRTARAKGVSETLVVAKHTLRNAALPIITITGLQLGQLLAGAVVTETVFAWPGIGRLAIQSIYNRDYPVVQCTVFLSAAGVHRRSTSSSTCSMASSIPASAPAERGAARAARRGWRSSRSRSCAALFVMAAAAPLIAPHDPVRQSLRMRLKPPTLEGADGLAHPLGTDHLGRDVLSRVIYGSRVSLLIGFAAVGVGTSHRRHPRDRGGLSPRRAGHRHHDGRRRAARVPVHPARDRDHRACSGRAFRPSSSWSGSRGG